VYTYSVRLGSDFIKLRSVFSQQKALWTKHFINNICIHRVFYLFIHLLTYLFRSYWGLKSEFHASPASALTLEPLLQPLVGSHGMFFMWELMNWLILLHEFCCLGYLSVLLYLGKGLAFFGILLFLIHAGFSLGSKEFWETLKPHKRKRSIWRKFDTFTLVLLLWTWSHFYWFKHFNIF
jgi:hypothetical protein